jgi:hypothetical protein
MFGICDRLGSWASCASRSTIASGDRERKWGVQVQHVGLVAGVGDRRKKEEKGGGMVQHAIGHRGESRLFC